LNAFDLKFFSVECVATYVVELVVLFVLVLLSISPLMSVLLARIDLHSLANRTDSIVGPRALVFMKSPLHCVDLVPVLVEVARVCHFQWSTVSLIRIW
jgi:hypothetical protein